MQLTDIDLNDNKYPNSITLPAFQISSDTEPVTE